MHVTSRRDERGSMIIALSVIMIVTTLSLAVLGRTLAATVSARRNQSYAAALGQADAGVSDAAFRLDQLGQQPAFDFCVGALAAGCDVSEVPGAPGTIYNAVAESPNRVVVQSRGTIDGVPHAVEAVLERDRLYPFAMFGKTLLRYDGSSSMNIRTVLGTAACSVPNPPDPQCFPALPDADVGSNSRITCSGAGSPAEHYITFPGGTSDCVPRVLETGSFTPRDPVLDCPAPRNSPPTPCRGDTYSACPDVDANAANGFQISGEIPEGRYYCPGTIHFVGAVSIPANLAADELVEIFAFPTYLQPPGQDPQAMLFPSSQVNVGGDPTKLRVYIAGTAEIVAGQGALAGAFTGILYAPSAFMDLDGCKADWRGAMTLNVADCNGGPNLRVLYDTRVADLVADNWTVKQYREIPSRSVEQ